MHETIAKGILKMKSRLLLGFLLVMIMVVSLSPNAEAANLGWQTKQVYFEGNKLVVDGYFINNGERTIVKINQIHFTVDVGRNEDQRTIADFTVYNKDIYMEPGETYNYRFWTTDAERTSTSPWSIRWNAKWSYE